MSFEACERWQRDHQLTGSRRGDPVRFRSDHSKRGTVFRSYEQTVVVRMDDSVFQVATPDELQNLFTEPRDITEEDERILLSGATFRPTDQASRRSSCGRRDYFSGYASELIE